MAKGYPFEGFQSMGVSPIHPFKIWIFHHKPSIFGYPHDYGNPHIPVINHNIPIINHYIPIINHYIPIINHYNYPMAMETPILCQEWGSTAPHPRFGRALPAVCSSNGGSALSTAALLSQASQAATRLRTSGGSQLGRVSGHHHEMPFPIERWSFNPNQKIPLIVGLV